MPELPEVEITKRGLADYLVGATIADVVIRNPNLRWPIPKNLPQLLRGQKILTLTRRAKYILADCGNGTLILHLGMSGSLRILPHDIPAEKHDHFDLALSPPSPVRPEPDVTTSHSTKPSNGQVAGYVEEGTDSNTQKIMRLRDPRRFGAVLWHEGDINTHPLLTALGPEPLGNDNLSLPPVRGKARMGVITAHTAPSDGTTSHSTKPTSGQVAGYPQGGAEAVFDAHYLYQATRKRSTSIKQIIMDNHIVVGVGNIYANEALFRSGIKPQLAAGKLSLPRCEKLVTEIRATLRAAIEKGGSSLRDFVHSDGSSGYFQQEYFVYGRMGSPCRMCGLAIKQIKQGQRSTFYCESCQR